MIIKKNISLKPFNTFNVEAKAKYFAEVTNISEFETLFETSHFKNEKRLLLGGGSNILFSENFDGIVIKNSITGIELIRETNDIAVIKAGAGVEWDFLVEHTVNKGFYGLENLSLIPGTVGASPIQNIGAYGVEVKDLIDSVDGFVVRNGYFSTIPNSQCNFGYRTSTFKEDLKDKFIVTSVQYTLSKRDIVNLKYTPLKEYINREKKSVITAKDVRNAVISIRESKLPNPNKIGSAGSFFKNPIINREKYDKLKTEYSDLVGFPESDSLIKISAGWLIEKCGLKGKRIGDVGVHEKQALVIVNYGNAAGAEIVEFSQMIKSEVENKFKINLINEVNII